MSVFLFSSASFLSAANAKISLVRFGYIANGINQTLYAIFDKRDYRIAYGSHMYA